METTPKAVTTWQSPIRTVSERRRTPRGHCNCLSMRAIQAALMLVLILALCIRQVKVCGRIEDELRTCLRELAMRVWEKHAITSESRAWKGETRSGPPIYFDEPATQIMPKAASILVWHTLMVEDWIRMRSWRWNRSIAPVMRGAQRGVPISAICIWPVMGSTKIVPLRAKRSRKRAIRESRAHVLR